MFWRTVMSARLRAYFAREAADDAKLRGGDDAVGNADAHHEVFGGQALAALAAGSAHAVALGVDAPPLEVAGSPVGQHAGAALAGKRAHLIEGLPRVLFALQALRPLGIGLFLLELLQSYFPLAWRQKTRGSNGCFAGIWKPWISI